MSTFALFVAMLAPAIFVAAALAQAQPPATGRRAELAAPRRDDAGPGIGERGRGSNREYRALQDGDNPE